MGDVTRGLVARPMAPVSTERPFRFGDRFPALPGLCVSHCGVLAPPRGTKLSSASSARAPGAGSAPRSSRLVKLSDRRNELRAPAALVNDEVRFTTRFGPFTGASSPPSSAPVSAPWVAVLGGRAAVDTTASSLGTVATGGGLGGAASDGGNL